MRDALLRGGTLGFLRRWLQVGAQQRHAANSADELRLQQAVVGVCVTLAPRLALQPAYLQASRGLGKLLLLLAHSPSSDPTVRDGAKEFCARLRHGGK
jgi:hypothetical protein